MAVSSCWVIEAHDALAHHESQTPGGRRRRRSRCGRFDVLVAAVSSLSG